MPCRVATENIKGICYSLEKENKQTNKNESKNAGFSNIFQTIVFVILVI